MAALVLSLLAALPQLGAEDYAARESATRTLRASGPLAWGLLWPLRCSECPEVRDRAFRLTRAAEAALSDAEAIRQWFAGDEPTAKQLSQLHDDAAARYRLHLSARRLGLSDAWAEYLRDADTDIVGAAFGWRPYDEDTRRAIDGLRREWSEMHPEIAPQPRLENR
jgi:hypothetical protein